MCVYMCVRVCLCVSICVCACVFVITHSKVFLINGYIVIGQFLLTERERNVLFNDALNTSYLRLYGVIHMVKDHSGSEGSFIYTIPQTG